MTPACTDEAASAFNRSPPELVASVRHTVRFLFITAGIAAAATVNSHASASPAPRSKILLYVGFIAMELLLAWFIAVGVRARSYSVKRLLGKGWKSVSDGVRDIVLAVGFFFLLRSLSLLLFYLVGRWQTNTAFLLPNTVAEAIGWIAVAITGGFCEEFVYRGYLQRQLWSLSRSLPTAILLQAIVFGAAHFYQGWRPAILTAVYGIAFGFLAAWRRSILPGALAHTLIDIVGGLVRH